MVAKYIQPVCVALHLQNRQPVGAVWQLRGGLKPLIPRRFFA